MKNQDTSCFPSPRSRPPRPVSRIFWTLRKCDNPIEVAQLWQWNPRAKSNFGRKVPNIQIGVSHFHFQQRHPQKIDAWKVWPSQHFLLLLGARSLSNTKRTVNFWRHHSGVKFTDVMPKHWKQKPFKYSIQLRVNHQSWRFWGVPYINGDTRLRVSNNWSLFTWTMLVHFSWLHTKTTPNRSFEAKYFCIRAPWW